MYFMDYLLIGLAKFSIAANSTLNYLYIHKLARFDDDEC